MNAQFEKGIRGIMSGQVRGAGPSIARGALAAIEPFYTAAISLRNGAFDSGLRRPRHLPKPVISVGNITTGGTGKSPTVRWLAERLREVGHHVAILSRGYRSAGTGQGDELTMLSQLLNQDGRTTVQLCANPDRRAGGESVLSSHPQTDVFLLDDGFQHRRLARDFDLVLVSALEPFGFGHVLPRGMLREPLRGLQRASAILITHADQVDLQTLLQIESVIHRYSADTPIFKAVHTQVALRQGTPSGTVTEQPLEILAKMPFFAFCGIGNPQAFERQLLRFGPNYVGHQWFGDHHQFMPDDLDSLQKQANQVGSQALITTEKDWVKIAALDYPANLPILRVDLQIQFMDDDEQELIGRIKAVLRDRP